MQPSGSSCSKLSILLFMSLIVSEVLATANLTTLYYVQPNTPTPTLPPGFSFETAGTTIISPAGDGVFVVQILNSLVILHGPSTTQTLLNTPTKQAFTLSEDASSLHLDVRPTIGQHDNSGPLDCTLDRSASTGKCVGVIEGVSTQLGSDGKITIGPSYTQSTTFSGNLVPIATVAVSSASSLRVSVAEGLWSVITAATAFYVLGLMLGMAL